MAEVHDPPSDYRTLEPPRVRSFASVAARHLDQEMSRAILQVRAELDRLTDLATRRSLLALRRRRSSPH
ncbi:hypothetical protein [Streptomyces sp. NPDC005799]|uniref:hypothetical protein n=1 Tax=Streptomyces sp. NPDC005799 TaxID=3154678 RepID=UPI0033E634D6